MESKTKLEMIKCRLESLVYPEEINQEILELLSDVRNDLEVLDILKKSIYHKEQHKRVYEPVGEPFFMIGISVKGEKNIEKVKGWVK